MSEFIVFVEGHESAWTTTTCCVGTIEADDEFNALSKMADKNTSIKWDEHWNTYRWGNTCAKVLAAEKEVSKVAYALWLHSSKMDGLNEWHWYEAERLIKESGTADE